MNTDKWIVKIDQLTEAFRKLTSGLSSEDINWKLNEGTWSIAQNMDHLIVINSTYFPVLAQIRAGSYKLPWIAKLSFVVNFFGEVVLKSVQPDRRKKMKTFAVWEPSASKYDITILQKFEEHQLTLKEFIRSCSDLLENGVIISSPGNKVIVYKLETAFDIIVTHEARHLEQAKELLNLKNN